MKNILLFIILFLLKFSVSAQSGSLDISFGTGGKVTTDFGSGYDDGRSVAIQNDGKIVVAGTSHNGTNTDFSLVRYNSDGNLDNTFGSGGIVTTDFGSDYDYGSSVAIQSNGKIVVAGYSRNGTYYDFGLVRYNNDGSLDNTFGTFGKLLTDIGGESDLAFSLAIQSDGKILVAGYCDDGLSADFALVRYNTDGSLDNSFDSDGKATTDFGSPGDEGSSVVIQTDGKIVVVGHTQISRYHFALVRYNNDGSLDNTFGSGGKVITDFGGYGYGGDMGRSVAIQGDGKIIVAGYSFNSDYCYFALARYNNNGILDNAFDFDGKVTTANGMGNSLVLQSDGKIIVAGESVVLGDWGLIRYNTDGSLDNSFDSDGEVNTDFGSTNEYAWSVAIQSDGKILLAGVTGNYTNGNFAVARYNGDVSVGMEEKKEISDERIFPNPSSGIFTINLKNKTAETKICVYDVLGNCVLDKISVKNSNQEIDLSNQAKGIYFMEIISDREREVQKIILQ